MAFLDLMDDIFDFWQDSWTVVSTTYNFSDDFFVDYKL